MDILQYLIELLKIRKEIGIEGLGTLYKKKTPGRYDATLHSFVPPSHVLEFTTVLTENVNFAQYIQTKRNISKESATYFINDFVTAVKQGLADKGNFTLENLGTFNLIDNQLTFSPIHQINIGFDFFALPPVTASVPTPTSKEEELTTSNHLQEVLTELPNQEIEETVIEPAEVNQSNLVQDEEVERVEVEANTGEETPETSPIVAELTDDVILTATEIPTEVDDIQEATEIFLDVKEADTEFIPTSADEARIETSIEEVIPQPIEPNVNALETVENEAAQSEIVEEIPAIIATTTVDNSRPTAIEDEQDLWDFDNENVISPEDSEEEKPDFTESKTEDAKYHAQKSKQAAKINTTTNTWDFDDASESDRDSDSQQNEPFKDIDEPDNNEVRSDETSFFKKMMVILLIVGAAIAAVYLYNPDLFNGLLNKQKADINQKMAIPLPQENLKTQQDSLSFADSIMQNAEKAGLNVTPAKDTIKVTAKAKPLNAITYEIIAAALSTNREVEKYIATMKKNGFDAKIANMPGKIYKKISIASYTNRDSATRDLKKLRIRLKNPDLYIFEDKNK